jgi:hypothetical protein
MLASAVTNPQPGREQRCSRWEGTVSGNDPSVKVAATLCEQDGKVSGTLEWKSDRSGTSTRGLEGTRKGSALVLRVVARPHEVFEVEAPVWLELDAGQLAHIV